MFSLQNILITKMTFFSENMQQTIIVEKTKEENRVALQISANVTPLIPKHFFLEMENNAIQ